MGRTATLSKSRYSTLGAPTQPKQSSRKGKKAWRKNVDISAVEEGLEEAREEERITGGRIKEKKDEELFMIDLTGDEKIRRNVRPKKPLTSTLILSQRSAVPAVYSKSSHQPKPSIKVTREDKDRLSRAAKRPRKGPLNSIVDTSEFGMGSSALEVSRSVKESGGYNLWSEDVSRSNGQQAKELPKPKSASLRSLITAPPISTPHEGTSYNPPVEAHSSLLQTAISVEKKRLEEESQLEEFKKQINGVLAADAGVEGMILDVPGEGQDDERDEEEETGRAAVVRATKRKTAAQRRRKARQAKELQELKDKAASKKLLSTLSQLKSLKRDVEKAKTEQDRLAAQRKIKKMERLKKGLVGQRVGRHVVREADVDVQLGEELSENLRSLKVEGNLFQDRFLSMQNRALIEPRTRVLPTKRKTRIKEVEKFAWKRFS